MTTNFWEIINRASMHNASICGHISLKPSRVRRDEFSSSMAGAKFAGLLGALYFFLNGAFWFIRERKWSEKRSVRKWSAKAIFGSGCRKKDVDAAYKGYRQTTVARWRPRFPWLERNPTMDIPVIPRMTGKANGWRDGCPGESWVGSRLPVVHGD